MTVYIALLRAVNVGGTGKLPMADLRAICEEAGLDNVRTYIASGNVVFSCAKSEETIKSALEDRLQTYAGKPVGVVVRTVDEMTGILADNPFPDREARFTATVFLDRPPPKDALDTVSGRGDEEIALGKREIYVHYPSGMGKSKLRIRAADKGTARNMNTVAKLAEMAGVAE